LIVVCARCHRYCRHLFVAAANIAAIATAIAATITTIVTVTNGVVTVIIAISNAAAANDNGNGGIVTWLGWLWVVS
jgi:hypothetical protein